ncbi:metal-dependent hydrolase, partial [bacterium]
HTHTVPGCLVLAGLLFLAAWAFVRWRGARPGAGELRAFGAMAVLATGLHLAMDALNSYGVHPWWPLDSRWYYGDAVFIVEPSYWLATAPLLFVLRSVWARALLALPLVAAVALQGFVHQQALLWPIAAGLALLALAEGGRRVSPRAAAATAVALMVAVTATFVGSRVVAAREVDALAARSFPDSRTLDVVLSPLPTHPGCWDVLLVQEEGARLLVRHGQLAILGMPDVAGCRLLRSGESTGRRDPVPAKDDAHVRWIGQFDTSLAELRRLASQHCDVRNLLQFVRAPYVGEWDGHVVVGDVRFDQEPGADFADLEVTREPGEACRYHLPWVAPRAELFEPTVRP